MALTPLPLTELPAAAVAGQLALVAASVQEAAPEADLRAGPLADLVVYPNALLAAQAADLLERAVVARRPAAVAADPDADPDATAAVLADWGLAADPGSAATGDVTVVVSADTSVTVPRGGTWRAGGRTFVSAATITAKAEAALVTAPGDRLLRPLGSNRWAFEVPLTAAAVGPAGAIRAGTPVAPEQVPANFLSAAAAADFAGGRAAETPADLLTKLRAGRAAAVPAGRDGVAALLRADPRAGDGRVFVAGHGDPEQRRDRANAFGLAAGGRVDWWVRPAARPARTRVRATAVSQGAGVWRVDLGPDLLPGCYELTAVLGPDEATAVAFTAVRGFAPQAGTGVAPDLPDAVAAAFSRFQTWTLTLSWDAAASGVTRPVTVEGVGFAGLDALQDAYAAPGRADPAADLLVRAAVPVFVRVALTVAPPAGAALDAAAVAGAVAAAVNALGFGEPLLAGRVYAAALAAAPAGSDARGLALDGRAVLPDGTQTLTRSNDLLTGPTNPTLGVSPRVSQFVCDPADVAVTAG